MPRGVHFLMEVKQSESCKKTSCLHVFVLIAQERLLLHVVNTRSAALTYNTRKAYEDSGAICNTF